jgi:Ca2+-binding EF-hand superfamily protein
LELPERMRSEFGQLDADNDGYLSRREIEKHAQQFSNTSVPVEVTYIWIMDADQGRVDLQQLQDSYSLLRKIDKNNDGQISRDELRDRREQVVSKWCDQCFKSHDKNDDGELSKSEARDTSFSEDFDKMDQNQDQMLTKSEIHRFVDNQMKQSDQQQSQARRDDQSNSGNSSNDRSKTSSSSNSQKGRQR